MAAIDPSEVIFTAAAVLKDVPNVQLYKASIDNPPFPDDYFDFGFSQCPTISPIPPLP